MPSTLRSQARPGLVIWPQVPLLMPGVPTALACVQARQQLDGRSHAF